MNNTINITIDGKIISCNNSDTILKAAQKAKIYIPTLCYIDNIALNRNKKPNKKIYRDNIKLENFLEQELLGCGLCIVEIAGELDPKPACTTKVNENMIINTNSSNIKKIRKDKLIPIINRHPHACLTCSQSQGCSRTQCSSNVPENERCCSKFGNCELQRIVKYIGISTKITRWKPTNIPILKNDPLFERNYNLCIGCTRCVRVCENLCKIGALGFIFDNEKKIQIGTIAPTLTESSCRFCTTCVEVCPTGAITDTKYIPPSNRIESLIPCKSNCTANINIPEYIQLIALKKIDDALATIYNTVPLPGILGRVCPHPCEKKCRRGEINEPINICLLKRFTADYGSNPLKLNIKQIPPTNKKIGIIGAGPAGLTTGFFLAYKGHNVTIFEAETYPGGMLRYGIPDYRLPEKILFNEINKIINLGVKVITNTKIKNLDELKNKNFDAIFISVGAQLSRHINIEGYKQKNILWGLDFLKSIRQNTKQHLGPKVIVIGGGNVALDAAMSALHQGAKSVDIFCLEKREDMPAHTWEIKEAQSKGINIYNSWGPLKINNQEITFISCKNVFDEKGNFKPIYDKKYIKKTSANEIIIAIGQMCDLSFIDENKYKISTINNLIKINPKTMATDEPGIYAGGDVVTQSGTVIQAISTARQAASSIDIFLGGNGNIDLNLSKKTNIPYLGKIENFAKLKRITPKDSTYINRNIKNHNESYSGYNYNEAISEAARCLQCQLRLMIKLMPPPPEKNLLLLTEKNINNTPETEGVIILYDSNYNILVIKGVINIKEKLQNSINNASKATYFEFEKNLMYSKAENEHIQFYLQQYNSMPPGDGTSDDDLDNLF